MACQSRPSRAWNYAQVSIVGCVLLVTGAGQAMEGHLPPRLSIDGLSYQFVA